LQCLVWPKGLAADPRMLFLGVRSDGAMSVSAHVLSMDGALDHPYNYMGGLLPQSVREWGGRRLSENDLKLGQGWSFPD